MQRQAVLGSFVSSSKLFECEHRMPPPTFSRDRHRGGKASWLCICPPIGAALERGSGNRGVVGPISVGARLEFGSSQFTTLLYRLSSKVGASPFGTVFVGFSFPGGRSP